MFKVLILLSGIFLNAPFTGNINSDPLFTSKEDCTEFLGTEDMKNQVKVILQGLLTSGHKQVRIESISCEPEDHPI